MSTKINYRDLETDMRVSVYSPARRFLYEGKVVKMRSGGFFLRNAVIHRLVGSYRVDREHSPLMMGKTYAKDGWLILRHDNG